MNIDHIHWHDCVVCSVTIDEEASQVRLHVEYPVDWERNEFAPRVIDFSNAFAYKEFEGPFVGRKSLLAASVSEAGSGHVVRIETNAGYREVTRSDVHLKTTLGGREHR